MTNEKKQLNVMIPSDVQKGVFSNVAQVNVSPTEVIFDFAFLQPNTNQAVMVSRVILTKEHASQFRKVFNGVMDKYEETKK